MVYYCRHNLYKSYISSPGIAQSICTAETKSLYSCVDIYSGMIACCFVICVVVSRIGRLETAVDLEPYG